MPDPVGSTSWPGRHHRVLARLAELLRPLPGDPTIIVVGPGAATRLLHRFLADASQGDRQGLRRYRTDLARYGDQLLRRIPWLPLVSFEPLEVTRAIGRTHRLVVVDRSRRVLAAVRRDLPDATCERVDIAGEPIPAVGDAVIAFNVVSRIEAGDRAMAMLTAAVKPGGLLLIDDRSARRWLDGFPDFAVIADKMYRRKADDGY